MLLRSRARRASRLDDRACASSELMPDSRNKTWRDTGSRLVTAKWTGNYRLYRDQIDRYNIKTYDKSTIIITSKDVREVAYDKRARRHHKQSSYPASFHCHQCRHILTR